jgi:hypothetical protein
MITNTDEKPAAQASLARFEFFHYCSFVFCLCVFLSFESIQMAESSEKLQEKLRLVL